MQIQKVRTKMFFFGGYFFISSILRAKLQVLKAWRPLKIGISKIFFLMGSCNSISTFYSILSTSVQSAKFLILRWYCTVDQLYIITFDFWWLNVRPIYSHNCLTLCIFSLRCITSNSNIFLRLEGKFSPI